MESARILRWMLIGLLVVCLLGIGGYFGYKGFREYRANDLATQAETVMEDSEASKEALRDAWENARAAYQLRPMNLKVARTVAKIHDKLMPEKAWEFWAEVVKLEEAELIDQSNYLQALIRGDQLDRGEELWERLVDDYSLRKEDGTWRGKLSGVDPEDFVRFMQGGARLAAAREQLGEALRIMRAPLDNSGIPAKYHFFYVQLTQISDDPQIRERGIEYLKSLAERSGDLALKAVRQLVNVPGRDKALQNFIIRRLEVLSETRNDELLRLQLELEADPDSASQIVQEAQELFDVNQPKERVELGRWLNRNQLYEVTLQLIPPEKSRERQDFFLLRADALALLNRWEKLQEELDDRDVPLESHIDQAFKMRAAYERKEFRRAQRAWDRSILEAGNDISRLRFLARYAERLELSGYRQQVLEKMAELPRTMREASIELMKSLERDGKTREVLNRLETLAVEFPDDTSIQNDLAYYNLLLNENVEKAKERAETLIERDPNVLAPYMTLALALLRQEKPREALDALRQLNVNWDEISARWKVIVSAVLAANGEDKWAKHYRDQVRESELLPEEKATLRTVTAP